jgi:pentose-5-phosphate-3-epimerase
MGITFAFFANAYFNFNIPEHKRNQAFLYFSIISAFSSLFQLIITQFLDDLLFTYEQNRIIISGCLFIIAYFFHRRYSFKDFKKVGIAIYANGVENLVQIYENIGFYLDFIHVDIIDKTMNAQAEDVKTYSLETMRAYWPNKQIQTHIMSLNPKTYLKSVLPHSDVVYIHADCKNNIKEIFDEIKSHGKQTGLALTMDNDIDKVLPLLKLSNYVLLLTIKKIGQSGQKFDINALKKIEIINNLKFRRQFTLCIDGGVNELIINSLKAENVVSGSSVLNNNNPKKQIMRLQTASRYESI